MLLLALLAVASAWAADLHPDAETWSAQPAVALLLTLQRADGSWQGLYMNGPGVANNVSMTSLACLALLRWGESPEALAAVEKGWAFVDAHLVLRVPGLRAPRDMLGSLTWTHVYTMELLAQLLTHPHWKDRQAVLKERLGAITESLCHMQHPTRGHWSYSTTFEAGAALVALSNAKHMGIDVPTAVLERGVKCLKAFHTPHGYYSYGAVEGFQGVPGFRDIGKTAEGSLGRMSVCDLALYRLGALTKEELDTTLNTFMTLRQTLWNIRKGEPIKLEAVTPGSYFVFFAYYYTAQALQEMGPARREAWGQALKKDLLDAREANGTWLHLLEGTSLGQVMTQDLRASANQIYGAAMALLSLQHLEQALKP